MPEPFTIFPAIDLLKGQVVRLKMGDPDRKTTYSDDPVKTAGLWIDAGAHWLHVVNLDGAFGESDSTNQLALQKILKVAGMNDVRIQFGGGIRSLAAIERALGLGVNRVILGTVVVEQPHILYAALERWGAESIAAGLDAQGGLLQVRGWKKSTPVQALDLAKELQIARLRWLVYTDIARDGLGGGVNIEQTSSIARNTSLQVIASGGVDNLESVKRVREAGMAGVIVGRALYSGEIDAQRLFGKEIAATQPSYVSKKDHPLS